jgi:hypothetical protein
VNDQVYAQVTLPCTQRKYFSMHYFLDGSNVLPYCPSDNSSIRMKMIMEHWWNDTDRVEWSIGGMILTGESGALVE